ncbi:hypothetical protein Nepgr_020388 [Nepenthes gracilis]|uniref:Uncharacterized protein n=1 Tax=Nepenthes gracilis TaxID=150966 RepID=A0AAD3SWY5_NEPGR|nr:hypothetical protein Nepgr_020388 [Nepenthes gracilis]
MRSTISTGQPQKAKARETGVQEGRATSNSTEWDYSQMLEPGLADTRCTSVPTMVLASGTAVAITGRGFSCNAVLPAAVTSTTVLRDAVMLMKSWTSLLHGVLLFACCNNDVLVPEDASMLLNMKLEFPSILDCDGDCRFRWNMGPGLVLKICYVAAAICVRWNDAITAAFLIWLLLLWMLNDELVFCCQWNGCEELLTCLLLLLVLAEGADVFSCMLDTLYPIFLDAWKVDARLVKWLAESCPWDCCGLLTTAGCGILSRLVGWLGLWHMLVHAYAIAGSLAIFGVLIAFNFGLMLDDEDLALVLRVCFGLASLTVVFAIVALQQFVWDAIYSGSVCSCENCLLLIFSPVLLFCLMQLAWVVAYCCCIATLGYAFNLLHCCALLLGGGLARAGDMRPVSGSDDEMMQHPGGVLEGS